MADPAVCILVTTYKRTDCAIKTIQALKHNLQWPQIWWMISDDGSPPGHVSALVSEIGPNYNIRLFNSERRGVGYGMNACLHTIFSSDSLGLIMEDDWVLNSSLDLRPYVNTLANHNEHGMIRFGYLSPNLLGYLISEEGKLFWRLDNNGETYRAVGHPRLVHERFFSTYGWYDEGLAPGMTELSLCGKVNSREGPTILYPAECGQWGFWGHIGGESLADINPEQRS